MLRDTGMAGPTTNGAVFARVPEAAVSVALPAFKVVASPVEFTVTTALSETVLSEVDQVTTSSVCEELSE
jgi:hypothetical protein